LRGAALLLNAKITVSLIDQLLADIKNNNKQTNIYNLKLLFMVAKIIENNHEESALSNYPDLFNQVQTLLK
jgi:hypothetical protein